MIVDMWMTPSPATIAATDTIAAAALLMGRRQVRRLLIVTPESAGTAEPVLAGIVTARDVARAFPPDVNPLALVSEDAVPAPVATIMTRTLHTTTPEAPIEEAARLLHRHKIGALPVVRHGRLVGIVTESDVFRAFVEMSGADAPGLRVTFELAPDEDVVATMVEICRTRRATMTGIAAFDHDDRRAGARRRLAVVRIATTEPDAVLDAIWASHHRVIAVDRHAGC